MAELACKYLELDLKSPVIVNVSNQDTPLDNLLQIQESGAGAIIVHSLFEEQLEFEQGRIIDFQANSWPGAEDYIRFYSKENSVENYLQYIESAKRMLTIPVFASINCLAAGEWIDRIKSVETAGADAFEINIFFFPDDKDFKSDDYEKIYYDIVTKVAFKLKIPVTVKLGPYFSNLPYIIDQIIHRGAKGVNLFNRFFHPDIDLDSIELTTAQISNSFSDFYQTLRWISIIAASFSNIEIAASLGIFNYEAVIKLLLAGANVIGIPNIQNEENYLPSILLGINNWMDQKGFGKIEQFQGQLNYSVVQDPFLFERSQFIKNFEKLL